MQEVQLDKNIQLLDCPGIVMVPKGQEINAILKNCVKVNFLRLYLCSKKNITNILLIIFTE